MQKTRRQFKAAFAFFRFMQALQLHCSPFQELVESALVSTLGALIPHILQGS